MTTTPLTINADEPQLLQAFRDAVIDSGAYAPEAVLIGANGDDDTGLQRTDRYAILHLADDQADQSVTAGGSRDILLLDAILVVTCYQRLNLDEVPEIQRWLLDDCFGAFATIKAVRSALHMQRPQSPTGDYILVRPLRYKGRDRVEKQKAEGWARTSMYFLFSYYPNLNPMPWFAEPVA
jgi:hypothetical protein